MGRRLPSVVRLASEELGLNKPVRRHEPIVLVPQRVAVFDDAANLHVRHAEDLGHVLVIFVLLYQLLVWLAGKGDDGAVGMDGSAGDVRYVVGEAIPRGAVVKLNVAILFALFGENLQPDV